MPVAQALHKWLQEFRPKVPDGSATATAMDYSLHRWAALTRYLGDPTLPIDNNFDEQQIRPWATGRKNWLQGVWPWEAHAPDRLVKGQPMLGRPRLDLSRH